VQTVFVVTVQAVFTTSFAPGSQVEQAVQAVAPVLLA
jgi:hypothetical protein